MGVVVAQISLASRLVLLPKRRATRRGPSDTDPPCTRNREARFDMDDGKFGTLEQAVVLVQKKLDSRHTGSCQSGAVAFPANCFLTPSKYPLVMESPIEQHPLANRPCRISDPNVGPLDPFSNRLLGPNKRGDRGD